MKNLLKSFSASLLAIAIVLSFSFIPTPAHASGTVKAYVSGIIVSNGVLYANIYYVNTTTDAVVDNNSPFLFLGTDITQYTNAEIISGLTTGILAESVAQGFGMTSADIIWVSPTMASARTFSTPTFSSSTTATQLSTTRDAQVQYAYDATVSISLLAGQSVTATLQYADNSAMSTNLVTVDSTVTSNSGVLGLTQVNTLKVSGEIPAGKYRKVTFAVTGSGTATPTTLKSGQEVLE